MSKQSPSSSERRSFLTYLNGGIASLAALAAGSAATAQEKPRSAAKFEPARHDKDDWLDELPGKHRLIFDTTTPEGVGDALLFAGNFLRVNGTEYGLKDNDLAVIIVVRHRSAPFGFKDVMWAKYGEALAEHAAPFEDPKTKQTPKVNVYNTSELSRMLPSRGGTLDGLTKRGVQLAVCASATRGVAGAIAKATDGNVDTIFGELTSNVVNNARMVPAGIVAVSRAQERGYSIVKT